MKIRGMGAALLAIEISFCASHASAQQRLPELLGETRVLRSVAACRQLEAAEHYAKLVLTGNDQQAAIQFFVPLLKSGLCHMFAKGEKAYVEKVGDFYTDPVLGHWVCVRPDCFWAPSRLLNDKVVRIKTL